MDSSENDLGRVKLGISGDLSGDESGVGGAGEIRLHWHEMAMPRSGVEVEQHPPQGGISGAPFLDQPAPPFALIIFFHTPTPHRMVPEAVPLLLPFSVPCFILAT